MQHPDICLLVVTGGPAVVRAAMLSGKKVIAAGPGNPPAVVDETADIAQAARDIVSGASLDNNIICIDEKVTVVVDSVADRLLDEMEKAGAYRVSLNELHQLEKLLAPEGLKEYTECKTNKKYVGKDARVILADAGIHVSGDPRLIVCDVKECHPFAWTEMLMPVMPVVRQPDVDTAIEYAVKVEGDNRHTASMYSKNIDKLSKMAHAINCSVFVKNAPNYTGLGFGGDAIVNDVYPSPTGEGLTTARDFSRFRRCTLVGAFRIV